MKKKWLFFTLVVVLFFTSIVAFRKPLTAATLEIAVKLITGDRLSYASRSWEDGKLIYENASLGESLYAARLSIEFKIDKFYLEPHLLFNGLDLIVDLEKERAPIAAALIPGRFFGLKLDVAEGTISIAGEERPILFNFVSGQEREKIGSWTVENLFFADLSMSGDDVRAEWNVENAPASQLVQLARVFSPQIAAQWQEFEGTVHIQGAAVITQKMVPLELQATIEAKEVAAVNRILGIFGRSRALQMDVHYPDIRLKAVFDGGEVHWGDARSIIGASGSFIMEKDLPSLVNFTATVVLEDHTYPIALQGKTVAAPFWMEAELSLESSLVKLSLSQPEAGKMVLEADMQKLERDGFGLLWNFTQLGTLFSLPNGTISGQAVAWWEEGRWKKIELDNLHISDFYLESSTLPMQGFIGNATGSLVLSEDEVEFADLKIDKTAIRFDQWHAHDIDAHLHVENGILNESIVKGIFAGIVAEFQLSEHLLNPQIVLTAAATPLQWLAPWTPVKGDLIGPEIFLSAALQDGEVHGTFTCAEDVVEFEWNKRGSFRSEKISAATYRPFFEALELHQLLQGDFSIEGSFDEKELKATLAGRGIGLDWRRFSLELDELEEAKLLYDFTTKKWTAEAKLAHVNGKDHTFNLVIEEFSGDLAWTDGVLHLTDFMGACSGPITALFSNGELFASELSWRTKLHVQEGIFSELEKIAFDFDYDTASNIAVMRSASAEIKGVPLSSTMARFKNGQLDFDLNVGEVLAFSGTGRQGASGEFHLQLVESPEKSLSLDITHQDVAFDLKWDRLKTKGSASLQAEGISCLFTAIEGVLPPEYQLCSPTPLYFSFQDGLGTFHFIATDRASQKAVAEVKGDGLEHVVFSYNTLKAAFSVRLDLPFVILQGSEDLLTLTFNPWSIDGLFQGVELHLSQAGEVAATIIDGKKAGQFFSLNWLKEISGIELTGNWSKEGFKGEVHGKEFEFKQKRYQEVVAEAEISPTRALFKNITINDPAGTFFIKQMAYENGTIQMPLVKVQSLRLSKEKPFLIRTLVLSDLRMVAGDIKTVQGSGSFNFTNMRKKESSIFDIPLEMLKNLGLDPDLFTPVCGEVSCTLKNGRLYLTDLKNAYSEGDRSQFFLDSEFGPSYIDLEGLFHINLRMKQNAFLKFAEPFTLAIRGPLEKPEVSLR